MNMMDVWTKDVTLMHRTALDLFKSNKLVEANDIILHLADMAEERALFCRRSIKHSDESERIAYAKMATDFFDIRHVWMKRHLKINNYILIREMMTMGEITFEKLPDQVKELLAVQNISVEKIDGISAKCEDATITVTTERHDRPFKYVDGRWTAIKIKKRK
jgi:hypothetical protein